MARDWGIKTNIVADFEVQVKAELHRILYRMLSRLGEESVKRIRNRPWFESWIDITGNLRSSIGYGVVINGQLVASGGCSGQYGINAGAEGKQSKVNGRKEGRAFIKQVASEYRNHKGFAFFLTAGMEYASYVEEMENKDVLNSTALTIYGKLQEETLKAEQKLVKVIERKYGIAA